MRETFLAVEITAGLDGQEMLEQPLGRRPRGPTAIPMTNGRKDLRVSAIMSLQATTCKTMRLHITLMGHACVSVVG
jgi:hypothetical protein